MKKYTNNTLVTRKFSDLTTPTGNIYEAVAIISKRARQVALYMKEDLDKKLADFVTADSEEIHEEDQIATQEQAEMTRLYEKLPKPTTIAAEEFLSGQLMYRYKEQDV